MRHLRQLFVCCALSTLTIPVGCGAEAPDGAEQASDIGSISLALVGTSATGATYRLSYAWFGIHGPTSRLVHGGGDMTAITEVLPVGRYDVYLEPGWILERWTGSGYQHVPAALTSANPTPVFVNEGATSTVMFQFRADGDVVSVGQGTLDILIGVDDTTPLREDNDVACSNGHDDDGDGLADCSDPECQWQPFCAPLYEDNDVACSNGYDDDGDGLADCNDPECQWQPFCAPLYEDNDAACSNGYDDDGDGLADCSDPECQWQPSCAPLYEDNDVACSNGYDDDGDGLADCSDPECQWQPFCATSSLLIEGFEDGDFFAHPPYATSFPPFTGPWLTLIDEGMSMIDMFPVGGPGTGTALEVFSPEVPAARGAGVVLSFDARPVDMSWFRGIRFKIRSGASPVRFELGTLLTAPEGGFCADCQDHHGVDIWVGAEWGTVEVRWGDLVQQGWGTPAPFEPWAVTNLTWRTPAGEPVVIAIDDVEVF
ncbi:hypothetical protein [Sorangium sp. So ce1097]|uniref:hypothetical protein n=1 Tax=Sorangium sp. So ce1097 TaxID=3133330 RepID=UPI003F5FB500